MPNARPPIRYWYRDPQHPQMSLREVESIIRESEMRNGKPRGVRLEQLGDKGLRQPEFMEIVFELDQGLMALFRLVHEGIPQAYTRVPVESHARRQYAAFNVSGTLGFEMAPVSAVREHPTLGRGSLTAMIEGGPLIQVRMEADKSKTMAMSQRILDHPTALPEAYLFDYLIGSGQRISSSYVVDKTGSIRSQYHHEAFSYTEGKRLAHFFERTQRKVTGAFWRHVHAPSIEMVSARLRGVLTDLVGDEPTKAFFNACRDVRFEHAFYGQTIHVLPDER